MYYIRRIYNLKTGVLCKGDMMMVKQLKKCFLFNHLSEESIQSVMESIRSRVVVFTRGEYIENTNREIGIVLKGSIEVQKNLITGKKIIMNKIKEGNVFGVAHIFQERVVDITSLFVSHEAQVMFVAEKELLRLFQRDEVILKNYLCYIGQRIYFLNQRLECFTQDNVRDRLVEYIEDLKVQQNSAKQVTLALSKSDLANYLGISRPSLYRVLRDLEEDKYLAIKGNKILLYN